MKRPLLILVTLLVFACTKNEGTTTPDGAGGEAKPTPTFFDYDIHGYVQKGQFVKGSQITAFAVDSSLTATGESFPSNILDDLGAFGIAGKTTAPYLDLRAEGYYFNETTGSVSQSPLYLEAFVKSDDKKANINLLTTAIRYRVKRLIKDGSSYEEAVSKAQKELFSALGITDNTVDFDDMDITGTRDADGMLLAFTCMIQSERTASDVTTFIQEMASDFEDGQLSPEVILKYKSNLNSIDPFSIIENLKDYYTDKALSVSTVPIFYKYLDPKYNNEFISTLETFEQPTEAMYPRIGDEFDGVQSGEIVSTLKILSFSAFTVESDVQGVTIEKTNILGPAYHLAVTIPANTSFEGRYVHLIFKNDSGKELARQEYVQGRDMQYLIVYRIEKNSHPVQDFVFKEGTIVSVNGEELALQTTPIYKSYHDSELRVAGVIIPKLNYCYVSWPANAVGARIETATTTWEGPIISPVVTVSPICNFNEIQGKHFGIADMSALTMTIPPRARMFPVLANVLIDLKNVAVTTWDHLEVQAIAENEYLAGTATYTSYDHCETKYSDIGCYDGITEASLVFENDKAKTITVNYSETLGKNLALFETFPQKLTKGFKATLFSSSGQILAEKVFDAISLKTGPDYTELYF